MTPDPELERQRQRRKQRQPGKKTSGHAESSADIASGAIAQQHLASHTVENGAGHAPTAKPQLSEEVRDRFDLDE